MVKAIWRGLAKPDSPIFSQGVYFATPILLKNLDLNKKEECKTTEEKTTQEEK